MQIKEAPIYSHYFRYSTLQHKQLRVHGVSVAGIGTCFLLPDFHLCIDVAQGLPFAFKARNYLITHAHMDHASGIPYIISQKALVGMKAPTFYMPQVMVDPLQRIMNSWQEIDGHPYKFSFQGVEAGDERDLSKNHTFRAFKTFHRIPSLGYTLYERRFKLKKDFETLDEHELKKLRDEKIPISQAVKIPLFTYTGDTRIEFWDENPEVRKSQVLFMEVTYWDDKKPVESAREWGHIHLDEVIDRLADFEGEKLVLTHISSRYPPEYLKKLLAARIPVRFQDKVAIFPIKY